MGGWTKRIGRNNPIFWLNHSFSYICETVCYEKTYLCWELIIRMPWATSKCLVVYDGLAMMFTSNVACTPK